VKNKKGMNLKRLKQLQEIRESETLFHLATRSSDALRRKEEERIQGDYRKDFAIDSDRILHSLAYSRYVDKTQVFYLVHHDHITHRILHVQWVSKISRTIGRYLNLNEDLIEAIALGHDIGHAPFGHDGEMYLSRICQERGIGYFQHNIQSIRFLEKIERKGRGWNLTLQVLDGILCHDGEVHSDNLCPDRGKDFHRFDQEIAEKERNPSLVLTPMTLEGCVVRIADTISYIGRDIEDAIRLNLIRRADIPKTCVEILGNTNGTIVYNLVTDLIKNSYKKGCIGFSRTVSDVLKGLKEFNVERIYHNPRIRPDSQRLERLFKVLFDRYVKDLKYNNKDSIIFRTFLDSMSSEYREAHTPEEIVRDFIAGMTDQFFLRHFPEELWPGRAQVCF